MEMIGAYTGIPFLFAGLGNVAGGWFSSALIGAGVSLDRARKMAFLCGAIATGAIAANQIGLLGDSFPWDPGAAYGPDRDV